MNTEKQKKKLEDKISEHYRQIDNLSTQLNDIYLSEAGDFTGSYVKYNDGNGNFRFMRVDHQDISYGSHTLILSGPMLSLDVDPLEEDFSVYDVSAVSYQDYTDIYLLPFVFKGTGEASITMIDREDFDLVVERCFSSMRKNIYDITYPEGQ